MEPFPLIDILREPKAAAIAMRDQIGATITMFNRVLGGACIIAGCTGRIDLLPELERLLPKDAAAAVYHHFREKREEQEETSCE